MRHFGHSKAARKRMAKSLYDVPRSQTALVPFYARFAAVVSQYYRDLGQELVSLLETEFTKLYEDSDVVKIESKIRNSRFLGELTKFNVCPSRVVLECLKKCLDDFHPHNIEIVIHLLDTCGKFLARAQDESVAKFTNLLDILGRLKESKTIIHSLRCRGEDKYEVIGEPRAGNLCMQGCKWWQVDRSVEAAG